MSEIFLFISTRFIKNIARTHAYYKRNIDVARKYYHQELLWEKNDNKFILHNKCINQQIDEIRNKSIDEEFLWLFICWNIRETSSRWEVRAMFSSRLKIYKSWEVWAVSRDAFIEIIIESKERATTYKRIYRVTANEYRENNEELHIMSKDIR